MENELIDKEVLEEQIKKNLPAHVGEVLSKELERIKDLENKLKEKTSLSVRYYQKVQDLEKTIKSYADIEKREQELKSGENQLKYYQYGLNG